MINSFTSQDNLLSVRQRLLCCGVFKNLPCFIYPQGQYQNPCHVPCYRMMWHIDDAKTMLPAHLPSLKAIIISTGRAACGISPVSKILTLPCHSRAPSNLGKRIGALVSLSPCKTGRPSSATSSLSPCLVVAGRKSASGLHLKSS